MMSKIRFRILVGLTALVLLTIGWGETAMVSQAADANWDVKYWNNKTLSGDPVLQRTESSLDYNWGKGSPQAGVVNVDNFSARWKRVVSFSAGTYRFTATTDDGMRVWVDDVLIIDSWWDSQVHSMSHDVYLSAGDHEVKVKYYEAGGDAIAKLAWTQVSGTAPTSIVNWKGEYYNNVTLSGAPALVRDDPAVNFDWGGGSPAWNVVAADQFSVRWTRSVSLESGRYRFTAIADDGVRLWVNGQLVVDQWHDAYAGTYTAEVDLPAGWIPLQMEYYENVGGAVAKLDWYRVGSSTVNVTSWRGEYYNNMTLSGSPVLVRDDPGIAFNWGGGSPASSVVADQFSARWTRTVALEPGRYRFTVISDDGARLWVNGQLLVDQWHDAYQGTYTADVDLAGGSIPLKLEYYENVGGAVAKLDWTRTGNSISTSSWRGEYYSNKSLSGTAVLVRDDAQINFNWGYGSPASGIVPADAFSVRWARALYLGAGRYRFTATTDDGVRVWVNNQLLIDAWSDHAPETHGGEIDLPAGTYPVKMEYYESTGRAEALLTWAQVPPVPQPQPAGQVTGVVKSPLLNVRLGPGLQYGVISQLVRNQTVTLVGYRSAVGTWVMINWNGGTAWISGLSGYLSTSVPVSSLPVWQGTVPSTGGSTEPTGTVTSYALNVRSGPGITYSKIKAMPRGTVVVLLGRNSPATWAKVRLADGTVGWMSGAYLRTSVPISSLPLAS